MPLCPRGHDSSTDDWCDDCGTPMDGPAPAAAAPADGAPVPTAALPVAPAGGLTCPVCHAPREGRFCEECGHDAQAPAPAPAPLAAVRAPASPAPTADQAATADRGAAADRGPTADQGPTADRMPAADRAAGWTAVVRADRGWFDEVRRRDGPDAAGLEFPPYCPDRRFALTGAQVAIGRRSVSRGTHPEIDLSGPPLDPGVSAQHALLVARPDGGWDVVDLGSMNGTSLDDDPALLRPHTPAPLVDGTRVRLGAWTTITIARTGP